jgi:hypothetical protein
MDRRGPPPRRSIPLGSFGASAVLAAIVMPMGIGKRNKRLVRKLFFVSVLTLVATSLISCGGGTSGTSTSRTAKSYVITITGTSGSTQHTTSITLLLQ